MSEPYWPWFNPHARTIWKPCRAWFSVAWFNPFLLLLFAGLANGQTVKLPAAVPGEPGLPVPLVAEADGDNVVWLTPDKGITLIDGGFFKGDSKRALVFGGQPGVYRVWALTAKGNLISPRAECVITIGTPPPPVPPVPPVPPIPPVPPVPPQPPAPIPADGFRVLIVYESAESGKIPASQQAILFTQSVRAYLNERCAAGADGKTKEWRMWDKDVDTSAETKVWQDAMKRPRQQVPWIVISDGKTGFEGPLPGNVADTLSLLKKYGG